MNLKWLSIASGVTLVFAIIPIFPYGYYILLRWFISIASIVVAYGFYKSKLMGWPLVFAAIAFIFNPIFPIYLSRSTWAPIDLIAAIPFFISSFSIKRRHI